MPDVLDLPVLPAELLGIAQVIAVVPGVGLMPEAPYRLPAMNASPFTAGAAISGHRALMSDGAGDVIHADPTAVGYAFVGISLQAAAAGTPVQVGTAGALIVEPSWSWAPGAALFVGVAGALTATPSAVGVVQQIGVALSATSALVQPFPPIILV